MFVNGADLFAPMAWTEYYWQKCAASMLTALKFLSGENAETKDIRE